MSRRRFLGVALAGGAALALPSAAPRRVSVVRAPRVELLDYPDRVVFTNEIGEWHVWKRVARSGDGVVGPGYVAFLRRHGEDRPLVDDLRPPGPINDPLNGGLGAFGWEHGRLGRGRWDIHARAEASRNRNFGVARARVLEPPAAVGDGASFAIRVEFRDAWRDPVLAVDYRYRVASRAVACWIEARQLWRPDEVGQAFVKEPKVVTAVAPVFSTVELLDDDGSPLRVIELANLSEPWLETAQLDSPRRDRVVFSGGARPFTVSMRAWDGRRSFPWHGAACGFDRWAQLSQNRLPFNDIGAAYCLEANGALRRRWEVARRTAEPAVSCLFYGWEGGAGLYDCGDASRAFGPAGESFAVMATYA